MKKWLRRILITIAAIGVSWFILTIWVEREGSASVRSVGEPSSARTALLVYDPDPIYDLDAQVCGGFARGLAGQGFRCTIATVVAADEQAGPFDLYVLCANTYNWRPDAAITSFVERRDDLRGAKVVAITLGSGSTEEAQRVFEDQLRATGAALIASRAFWLLRPNDESRMEERNVDVAVDMARQWGSSVGAEFKAAPPTAP